MRTILLSFACLLSLCFTACSNKADTVAVFCDTTCSNDTIKFTNNGSGRPYVYISRDGCVPDTIIWSHKGLPNNRVMDFRDLAGNRPRINKNYMNCYFNDTSYTWLEFNDCYTGRGYLLKLTYSIDNSIVKSTGALTHFDPRFKIQDGIICYTDRTFLYVEDIYTGKKEKVLMADHELDVDFDNIHNTFDSVNVSRNRVWINLRENGETRPVEKQISL